MDEPVEERKFVFYRSQRKPFGGYQK